MKEESEKVGLKLNLLKMKIREFCPITSWEIDGETVETVSNFIFWDPKSLQIVCSHDIKRLLSVGRKVMPNIDSILKRRDCSANKGLYSQGYGFSSGHIWM